MVENLQKSLGKSACACKRDVIWLRDVFIVESEDLSEMFQHSELRLCAPLPFTVDPVWSLNID